MIILNPVEHQNVKITRRYAFEAGHWLPGVPPEHKCSRKHGHNYEIDVTVGGPVDGTTGFIMDFWDLDKVVKPIIDRVDHRMLNDIPGLENPTAEHIAQWFLDQIPRAQAVRVYETKNCWADVP